MFWKTNVVFLAENLNQFFINFQFTRDLEFLKLDGKYQRPLVQILGMILVKVEAEKSLYEKG